MDIKKQLPKEKVMANISLTTHPKGIEEVVRQQFKYIESKAKFEGPKNVVILGGSAGYGLATRITLAAGTGAKTISLSSPRFPSERRPLGNPGFWGQNSFEKVAEEKGLVAKNIFANAFEDEAKTEVIKAIKDTFNGEKVDLLVYSIAAPKRKDPKTGILYSSSLKTLKGEYTGQTIDVAKKIMKTKTVGSATQEEIDNTVKVMGGEDWELWVEAFKEADVITDDFRTVAYTYLGSKMTDPIYRSGTIGKAKENLEATAIAMTKKYGNECTVASLKAVVTSASVFIPTFPIYASALMMLMKKKGTHEGTIEQVHRFYSDMYYGDNPIQDANTIYRPDNLELEDDIQTEVEKIMSEVTEDNFMDKIDGQFFIDSFYQVGGFRVKGVNYDEEIDILDLMTPNSLKEVKKNA